MLFFFFFSALVNQYTTEISFYKREEKEFILLFNKTLSDASHVLLSLLLEAGGSVVSKRDLQQLGNQEESGSTLSHECSPVIFTPVQCANRGYRGKNDFLRTHSKLEKKGKMKARITYSKAGFIFKTPCGLPRIEFSCVVCIPVVLIRIYLAAGERILN